MDEFRITRNDGTVDVIQADYAVLHANGALTLYRGDPLMAVLAPGDRILTEDVLDATDTARPS